jgi:putative redox protein
MPLRSDPILIPRDFRILHMRIIDNITNTISFKASPMKDVLRCAEHRESELAETETMRTDRINAICETRARTSLSTRDVSLTIDEPFERGGSNRSFSPTETFMASLMGCTNVIAHNIASEMGVEISSMRINLEYDFHFLGARLQKEIDLPFTEVRMKIDVTTSASDAQLERLKRDLRRYCPVTKMIEKAGCRIIETWNIRSPQV